MRLIIDGVIYAMQSVGGISRFHNEVLPRLCELEPNLHIDLFLSKPYPKALPSHPQIKRIHLLRRGLRPSRVFMRLSPPINRLIQARYTTSDGIWFSTYHTLPVRPVRAIVATVYDLVYERFPEMYCKPGEEMLRQRQKRHVEVADIVLCISETTARDVIDIYGVQRDKIRVVTLAPSPLFAPHIPDEMIVRPPTEKPFFLYVGNRKTHKNFKELLETYAQWPQRQQADIVAVGTPWTHEEKQRLVELGVCNQVHLLPYAHDEQLRHLYLQAVAFVFPSLWEGFGLPLLEAMACGCPVIASRIPSSVEVAGDHAVYFDLGMSDSLFAALELALTDGRNPARIQAGLTHASGFSWDLTARQVLDAVASLY